MGNDVEGRLKRMIVQRLFMSIKPEELDSDKSLIDDYGVDSVMLLELVVGLEEEFNVRIEDTDFSVRHFETVSRLADFVRSKL